MVNLMPDQQHVRPRHLLQGQHHNIEQIIGRFQGFWKTLPGCALRLRSIIQGVNDAIVEMAADISDEADLEQLKQDWKRMQESQREVLGILPAPACAP